MAEDYVDKMLKQAESGKLGGTLRQSRPEGKPMPRPKMPKMLEGIMEMGMRSDHMKPKSNAPAGMANAVKGDIGMYRQMEARKVFPGLPGKDRVNPLKYRKPAIEGGMGPHAV